jgi:hypothetical protein
MDNKSKTPNPLTIKHRKDKKLTLQLIVKEVERKTNLSLSELKSNYTEDKLFAVALKHVTTTKKALCTAFNIPIEAGCRYKRTLEKEGNLVQSIYEVICPFTKHPAHILSTNSKEFERLLKSNNNQTKLFE